ncbi:hypothetical protein C8A03DRAFT_39116 [Achaetomium macrosporum]|uniref:Uncharacterized protein n=1 Tax=Achaetomium macrosporum TaxID=79813 RepID=A0AAN7H9K7_9PEZI|nr:hypothetical protein C8A03DRAFT_39116 [Achaetomium macrosporum]
MATITHEPMNRSTIGNLVRRIAFYLEKKDYAIIGGVALQYLGSSRATADIDLLIPPGASAAVRGTLAKTDEFDADGATLWYNAPGGKRYNVDVLEAQKIRQAFPSSAADFITLNSAKILRPALLLKLKCLSWLERDDDKPKKKAHDREDIRYLLTYMKANGIRTSPQEVDTADNDFFLTYLTRYPKDRQLFEDVGLKPPAV